MTYAGKANLTRMALFICFLLELRAVGSAVSDRVCQAESLVDL